MANIAKKSATKKTTSKKPTEEGPQISGAPSVMTIEATIRGISPLLTNRFTEKAEEPGKTSKPSTGHGTPRQQATNAAYFNPDGKTNFIPGASIYRAVCEQGGHYKQKSSRKSMKYVLAAAFLVLDDTLTILQRDAKKPWNKFEVDSRPVTIPATKGRIMRHRPKWFEWALKVTIQLDITLIDEAFALQMLEEAGRQQGIGDYRPNRFGPMGRFEVIEWKAI